MKVQNHARQARRGKARQQRLKKHSSSKPSAAVWPGLSGGQYKPLSDTDIQQIHRAALQILAEIGMADATAEVIAIAEESGCSINQHGRLCFPSSLVEEMIDLAAKEYIVYSRSPDFHDIHIGGKRVHYATSGEAVSVLDVSNRTYRPSTLKDLYDFARMTDTLDNIHQFGQTVVPTELPDLYEHDINVAYALVSGTQKPCEMALNSVDNITSVVALFDKIAGGQGQFAKQQFVSFGGCPVVSPLRFAEENLNVLVATSRMGLINDIAIAPQAGATAPAYLAGTLAQVIAEGLACLCVVNMINPGCPMSFANWPFVADLRSGSFTGGCAEVAVASAAAVQMGKFYNLPTTVAASMSDSKLPDAQAGFEKGISSLLAGLAGANRVLESAGMLSSLMGCSFEALLIDNEMLGSVQRVVRGIEVNEKTLSIETIRETVLGDGHYLSHSDTIACMNSEYYYPIISDRNSSDVWNSEGSQDTLQRAQIKTAEILSNHYPRHISETVDQDIRQRFPIKLPEDQMRPA